MPWSASQYVKFEDERTRPARDLLAQVPLSRVADGIDLGCGPGNSTELLVDRFGAEAISGLDSDPDMLAAARRRLPDTRFIQADIADWHPEQPPDLVFANAVFQWLPDHMAIMERLAESLAPGGVLAVQMPDNVGEPSHILMEEAALSGPCRQAFDTGTPRRASLPSPADYYRRLSPKASRIDIWHTIYNHLLADAGALVEWVKGTGLRPYLDMVPERDRESFLADYRDRITRAYPAMPDGRILFRFPRLFIVIRR